MHPIPTTSLPEEEGLNGQSMCRIVPKATSNHRLSNRWMKAPWLESRPAREEMVEVVKALPVGTAHQIQANVVAFVLRPTWAVVVARVVVWKEVVESRFLWVKIC